MTETLVLKGIPAAPGLAKGPVAKVANQGLTVPEYEIKDVPNEITRLTEARTISGVELAEFKKMIQSETSNNEAEIFEAHMMILEDESLISLAESEIQAGKNAEFSWMKAVDFFAKQLEAIPDPTLSARAMDVRDVGQRVLRHLMGLDAGGIQLIKPSILVGRDLTPSDTVSLDKRLALSFLTAEGGPTSHTAILAKAFGLPAVVGLGSDLLTLPVDSLVLVDGNTGIVIVNPDQDTLDKFTRRQEAAGKALQEALTVAFEPACTKDGRTVEIVANIGSDEDASFAHENGAEGVGLFRTEFLYLHRNTMPSEDEQVEAYTQIFSHFQGQPVVVRTLDIGGDKEIPYLNFPKELNPFLGWRGVRMLHGREDILSDQIRSLLRAGVGVDLRIMVPMIALQEEIYEIKALIDKERGRLIFEKKPCAEKVQFGIMVEVPSAAILSDRLAKSIDFFSIGTNDLTQYTIAVDRTNSQVAHLASGFNPAVLFLIQRTIESAHAAGKWCGMCGEFAGEPLAVPILLGMGLDEFSMSPARIPSIKQLIRKLDQSDCQDLAAKVLQAVTDTEVKNLVNDFLTEREISIASA
ncbi:MAG: phosphoenolpyruvate--protein phosphotransferase [Anaerolineaceae bacterium]